MSNFSRKMFIPDENGMETLSFREKAQIPYVVTCNTVFFSAFLVIGIFLFFQEDIPNYLAAVMSLLGCVFIVSNFKVKKARIMAATCISTFGIILITSLLLFFMPAYESTLTLYRNMSFILAMGIFNQMFSIKIIQNILFFIFTFASWIASSFTTCRIAYVTWPSYFIVAFSICSIVIVASYVVIYLVNKFNIQILSRFEKENITATENYRTVMNVLEQSKAGLEIGKNLNFATANTESNIIKLNDIYNFLSKESESLVEQIQFVNDASIHVVDKTVMMKESVKNQNLSIAETSSAMVQISKSLENMSSIASNRSTSMKALVETFEDQMKLSEKLVKKVDDVRKSSEGIAGLVLTVDSIASQTGLLAMNASIEAAHAGNTGKGFSVIAQQIRKLSEETTRNAAQISEELKKNNNIVKDTAQSVNDYAEYTKSSIHELKEIASSIEAIIDGISEMNKGTQEVMKAIQNIVNISNNTDEMVGNVSSEIGQLGSAIEKIKKFATTLNDRTSNMNLMLDDIKTNISSIKNEASENVNVSNRINNILINNAEN